jgi:phage anti-repressor protein
MGELIPIIDSGNAGAVDGRLLHEFLGVKTVFANWIQRRIEKYGFIEGLDYEVFSMNGNNSSGGRSSNEYYISIDMAKQLAMVEDNDKGTEARKYFIGVEVKYKQLQKEIFAMREKALQKAQMAMLKDIDPEDMAIFPIANKFVNDIVADCFGMVDKKKKEDMNEQELAVRDDVLIKWVDTYKMSGSKSHANMVVRMMYQVKQVGKNAHLNKVIEYKEK